LRIYLIYYLLLILVKKNNIINDILNKWKLINPSFEIKYFSDADLDVFFKNTPYNDIYKNLKNGVSKSDFLEYAIFISEGYLV
tara:strand:- start:52 stop:300 length:249 start_codon:yes stop_codon:yes gene_type:complete